jgi:hypothetical protein
MYANTYLSCTYGGRHPRQVDARGSCATATLLGVSSGKEAVDRALATEARRGQNTRLDAPSVGQVSADQADAGVLKGLAGAIVLTLQGRRRRSIQREGKE